MATLKIDLCAQENTALVLKKNYENQGHDPVHLLEGADAARVMVSYFPGDTNSAVLLADKRPAQQAPYVVLAVS